MIHKNMPFYAPHHVSLPWAHTNCPYGRAAPPLQTFSLTHSPRLPSSLHTIRKSETNKIFENIICIKCKSFLLSMIFMNA